MSQERPRKVPVN